jgi:hypothetical protein
MSKLTNRLVNSLYSLLGFSVPERSHVRARVEHIRQAMLDSLGNEGCASHRQTARRVLFARDLQGLWYLRSDVMAAISSLKGESTANEELRQITAMFEDVLPKNMVSPRTGLNR